MVLRPWPRAVWWLVVVVSARFDADSFMFQVEMMIKTDDNDEVDNVSHWNRRLLWLDGGQKTHCHSVTAAALLLHECSGIVFVQKKKIIKHERLQQTPPLGGVDERSFHSFNCFVFYLELYAVSFGYFLPHSPPSSFVFLFVFFFTFLFSGLFVQIQLSNSLFLIHFVSGWYVFDFYLINKATSTSPSDNISLLQF